MAGRCGMRLIRRRAGDRTGPVRPWLNGTGQHLTEFVLLIGLVTSAVIGMQYFARQRMMWSVEAVVNGVFGEPPEDEETTQSSLNVVADYVVIEQGRSGVESQTTTTGRVIGRAVNEDARLTYLPPTNPIPPDLEQ